MSNLKLPNLHVQALETQLRKANLPRRGNYELRIAYETFARKIGDVVNIRHHSTIIGMVGMFSVRVSNGGWHSPTTANRIDRILRDNDIPFRAGIKNGRMELRHADTLKPFGNFTTVQFVMVSGLWEIAGVEYH